MKNSAADSCEAAMPVATMLALANARTMMAVFFIFKPFFQK
jgi:hypothetical protein